MNAKNNTLQNETLTVIIQIHDEPSVEDIRIEATPVGKWSIDVRGEDTPNGTELKGVDMLEGLAEEVGANVRIFIEMNPQFCLGEIENLLGEIYNTDKDEYLRIDKVCYDLDELLSAVELELDEDALGIELCAMAYNVG